MGTDIHMRLEVQRNGAWEIADDCMVPNHWHRENSEMNKMEWERDALHPVSEAGPRNYDAFAILGNVRNGTGFAGIKTGDGFKPLSDRRGLPGGAARLVEPLDGDSDDDGWYLGDHSFSWLTLRELVADDGYWNQSTGHCGYVSAQVYANWDKQGIPPAYCGDISGGNTKKVSRKEMDAILAALGEKPAPPVNHFDDTPLKGYAVSHFVFVEWRESYKDAAGYYYSQLIPALVQYAEEKGLGLDDVRLVFGFDS